jgi:Zonular occludens toxin (Zot)
VSPLFIQPLKNPRPASTTVSRQLSLAASRVGLVFVAYVSAAADAPSAAALAHALEWIARHSLAAARDSFVNRLQMSLFTFIKRNPNPTGCLYVIDEAQNFAPSGAGTACKASALSLAAQARKYGLGMMFATQTPKGVDNKIVSRCTTHVYGRMNAPATIDAIRELMAAKGGVADDIGKLSKGEFYFSTEGSPRPLKVRTSLCLSNSILPRMSKFSTLPATRQFKMDKEFSISSEVIRA